MHYRALSHVLGVIVATTAMSYAQLSDYSALSPSLDSTVQSSITGVVTDLGGKPLHDIRVEAHRIGTGELASIVVTGMNGSFNMRGLHPGEYDVIATEGVNECREQVHLSAQSAIVELRMAGHAPAPRRGTISVAQLRIPEKAKHLMEKARNFLARSKTVDAQKNVSAALAIAPDFSEALTFQAAMKLAANQPQAAIDDLDHAVKSDPSYSPSYLVLGAAYNQMGRYDDALRYLDRSAIYDPTSWQAAFEASKAWLGKKDYAHALQQINRAENLGAQRLASQVHLLKGYALMGQKKLDLASTEFQAYLTAEPHGQLSSSVRATLAQIKTQMANNPSTVPLPAMTGFFAEAH